MNTGYTRPVKRKNEDQEAQNMNKAAIERAAEIIDGMDKLLRSKLTEGQLFENTHIAKQIKRREQGGIYT